MVVIRHYMESVSFKEKDRQTIENGITIQRNIAALTGMKVSDDEAVRQRLFFSSPGELSMDDFHKAEELFKKEYRNLNDQLSLNQEVVASNLKQKLVKPYCKMAIHKINNKRLKGARKLTYNYLMEYGVSILPFLLWLLSYCGKKATNKMLEYFKGWQVLSVKLHNPPHV